MNDPRVAAALAIPAAAAAGVWVAPLYDSRGRPIASTEAPDALWANAILDMAAAGPAALYAAPSAGSRWVLMQLVLANWSVANRRVTVLSAANPILRVALAPRASETIVAPWRMGLAEAINVELDGAPAAGEFVHVAGRAYTLPG